MHTTQVSSEGRAIAWLIHNGDFSGDAELRWQPDGVVQVRSGVMDTMSKVSLPGWIARVFVTGNFAAEQVNDLAKFIMGSVPGEPSQSEGAVDCAIRLLRGYVAEMPVAVGQIKAAQKKIATLEERLAAEWKMTNPALTEDERTAAIAALYDGTAEERAAASMRAFTDAEQRHAGAVADVTKLMADLRKARDSNEAARVSGPDKGIADALDVSTTPSGGPVEVTSDSDTLEKIVRFIGEEKCAAAGSVNMAVVQEVGGLRRELRAVRGDLQKRIGDLAAMSRTVAVIQSDTARPAMEKINALRAQLNASEAGHATACQALRDAEKMLATYREGGRCDHQSSQDRCVLTMGHTGKHMVVVEVGRPDHCSSCEWRGGLLNYQTEANHDAMWLCHGCAARKIADLERYKAGARDRDYQAQNAIDRSPITHPWEHDPLVAAIVGLAAQVDTASAIILDQRLRPRLCDHVVANARCMLAADHDGDHEMWLPAVALRGGTPSGYTMVEFDGEPVRRGAKESMLEATARTAHEIMRRLKGELADARSTIAGLRDAPSGEPTINISISNLSIETKDTGSWIDELEVQLDRARRTAPSAMHSTKWDRVAAHIVAYQKHGRECAECAHGGRYALLYIGFKPGNDRRWSFRCRCSKTIEVTPSEITAEACAHADEQVKRNGI